ncbi:hypothetical protein PAHAL_8G084600 [Panicum hallii]|jgi:hypothetical protein|uniref:Uncharacterized protein n=1 Tax=Panicum hallii TaxID=206008 RepID=A0A2T8I8B5_9POAL|nr:hypothetical protein PAHAL_8G084600 [Panicum hallii]
MMMMRRRRRGRVAVAVAARGRRLMGLERNSCAFCSSALFGACLPRLLLIAGSVPVTKSNQNI